MKIQISTELRRLNHLHGELDSVYHEAALRLGLSDSAMCILYTICHLGDNCPLSEIVRLSGMSKQTINSALRNLEKDHILYMETAGVRSKNVCLTDKGKQFAEATVQKLMEAENEVFASWSQEDVQRYMELSECFLRDLRTKVDGL